MGRYVQIDESKKPIILLNYSEVEPSSAEFEEYLKDMEQIYKHNKDFVMIFDGTKAKYLSSELRSRQSIWIKQNATMIKQSCVGMVYVLPNVMVEIIFKCIVAFSPLPVKNTTVRSLQDAYIEAEKMLKIAIK